MIQKLIMRLRHYDELSADDERLLRDAAAETVNFRRGQVIVRSRTEIAHSILLVSGLVHSFRALSDGRRQAVQVAIPGDFIDLHGLLMKSVDHELVAMTGCEVVKFPHQRLVEITRSNDHLTRLLWLLTVIDGAIEREMITSLGVRSAIARLAHLFCELQVRLEAVGLAQKVVEDECSYQLPLNQEQLAEIAGITPVHINRMLKELRERGLLTFRGHEVRILDWTGLSALAEFDPFYLYMQRAQR